MPKLIYQPKWYDGDKDLSDGDLVYFQKKDGVLNNKWIVGKVEQVVRGRDQKVRKVIVKYFNGSEGEVGEPGRPRFTERSVRKLVKLFSIDEFQVEEDLVELQARIDKLQQERLLEEDGHRQENVQDVSRGGVKVDGVSELTTGDVPALNTRSRRRCNCCCVDHCNLSLHSMGPNVIACTWINVKMEEFSSFLLEEFSGEEDKYCGEDRGSSMFTVTDVLKSLDLIL